MARLMAGVSMVTPSPFAPKAFTSKPAGAFLAASWAPARSAICGAIAAIAPAAPNPDNFKNSLRPCEIISSPFQWLDLLKSQTPRTPDKCGIGCAQQRVLL